MQIKLLYVRTSIITLIHCAYLYVVIGQYQIEICMREFYVQQKMSQINAVVRDSKFRTTDSNWNGNLFENSLSYTLGIINKMN